MNIRAIAAGILVQVIHGGKFLTFALEPSLAKIPKENDRALVQALCYGVLRWYWRLDRVLSALTRKPIKDAEIRALALLGLFQLRYTRVKPHAAVAETVAAAGSKSWAKPLLNGILRSYQREQARLEAELETSTAAAAHPPWLIECLGQDWPAHCTELMDQNNQPPPLALRVNRRRGSREEYLARLEQAGIPARPAAAVESGILVDTPIPAEKLPGFAEGAISVQDTAAQLAAGLLGARPGQRVLDLCAAPGGKTAHILESCPEPLDLVAVDIAPERTARIRENLARENLKAEILTADAALPATWWDGRLFDRILVDAPCSATGVIRRHPDIKVLRRDTDIPELVELQRRILEAAWPLLAPGGQLLYATCSLLRRENEDQIGDFIASHPDAVELPIAADWGMSVSHGRQILTGDREMDGFFYAKLEKVPRCA